MLRVVLVTAALLLGACKGDRQKCESGCRNYFTLVYWDSVDKEIAAAPADQRDALRKKRLAEFSSKLENGVDLCVDQCSSANNTKTIDCMNEAKTADAQRTCTE